MLMAVAPTSAGRPTASLIVDAQQPDYPSQARAVQAEGDVPIALHIDASGALKCRVATTAAHPSLRRASCVLVTRRWPFEPNRDRQGKPQRTDVSLVVRWSLKELPADWVDRFDGATPIAKDRWFYGEDYPLEALRGGHQGRVGIAFDVTPDGKVANCTVEKPLGWWELNALTCKLVTARALFLPAVSATGQAITAKAHSSVRFVLPSN